MKVAALCAGYGGLELGLVEAGIDAEVAWVAETDPAASRILAAHHPDAPNLGDLTAITDPPEVDIVTAGFPCQPVSQAGSRKGITDDRWLIDDVCRVARDAGAMWLLLENVPGLLTANDGDAMAHVCAALARHGWDAEWTTVRASDVGAPHRRERWFAWCWRSVADAGRVEPERRRGPAAMARPLPSARFETRRGDPSRDAVGGSGGAPADTDDSRGKARGRPVGVPLHQPRAPADTDSRGRRRLPQPHQQPATRQQPPLGNDPDGRSVDHHRPGLFGPYEQAVDRWERIIGRPAPDPLDGRRLNPAFVEWMMGLPAGWVTGHQLGRTHELRILGNGVVPQQAAHAIRALR